jgi:hypothetical protein
MRDFIVGTQQKWGDEKNDVGFLSVDESGS